MSGEPGYRSGGASLNPVRWIASRLPSFRLDGGEAACLEGLRTPSWEECGRVGCESVRLSDAAEGLEAIVTCLEEPGDLDGRKLAGLGMLPGVRLVLLQRRPVFVVRIGYTELALDRELAARVRVRAADGGTEL